MGKGAKSSILGGCLGGAVGGPAGIVLGGWITYTVMSTEVELPTIGNPPLPLLVLIQMYIVAVGVPVLLGAVAGGIVGLMSGSLIGLVIFSKLQPRTIPREISNRFDVESPEARPGWVNGAIYGLVAIGLIGVVISTLMLISGADSPQSIALMLWGVLGVASGIMLSKRISGARALGIVFALPGVLVFPHGTVIALLLVYALCRSETTGTYPDNRG